MRCARTWVFLGLVLAAFPLLVACAQAPLDYPRTASWALANPEDTRIGSQIGLQLAAHPAQSGFCLLSNGPDALVTRLALVDAAERTLDAQCFDIEDDSVGNQLLDRMLAAGERGVRVRLLIDDWNQAGQDRRLAGVGAQPNIEVRVFNPVGSPRGCSLTRPFQYLFGPQRIRKRMHNKAMIVDNTIAILGGRNIAEGYFTASGDHNFGDIDILAAGPIAGDVSAAFDEFWNDRLAVPIEAFVSEGEMGGYGMETRRKFEAFRSAAPPSPHASSQRASQPAGPLEVAQLPLIWSQGELLSDRPAKILTTIDQNPSAYMVFKLKEVLDAARMEALLTSPYLVPGNSGMEYCRQMRARGVAVKILTNSLASTDEVTAHAGYARYRDDLLRSGVEVYELRPDPDRRGKDRRDHEGSSAGAGLHAKYLVVDQKVAVVGSFNLDPRSVQMDTQNGIVVRSEELAAQLSAVFARRTSGGYAYRVTFLGTRDGRLVWIDEIDGKTVHYSDEPMAGPGRRLKAWFLNWLVPESWL